MENSDLTAKEDTCEVAVLGAGVAGLFAARALKERDVIVLECEDRPGGRVESESHGDYWVNLGAQFTEGVGPLIEAMDEFDIERGSLDGKNAGFAWGGKVVSSHSPARLILETPMSLLARIDLALLGLKILRAYKRLTNDKDKSGAEKLRRELDSQSVMALAKNVRTDEVRKIFRVWARHWTGAEPDNMAASQFVMYLGSAMVKAQEVPNFSLPVGGNQVLTDALANSLGERLRLNSRVTEVEWDDTGVRISYDSENGPRVLHAKRCVVALTTDVASKVLKDLDPKRREALSKVRYGKYVLAGIFTNETGPQPWDDYYAIATPGLSFQVMYNHAAAIRGSGPREPGGAVVCYAGGEPAAELAKKTDDEIREIYRRDLDKLYPGMGGVVEKMVIRRVERVVPHWLPNGREDMELFKVPLGPIHFAGDFLGYPAMTLAAYEGDKVGRKVATLLS